MTPSKSDALWYNSTQSTEHLPNESMRHRSMDEYLVVGSKYEPNAQPTCEKRSLYCIALYRWSITQQNELLQLHTAIGSLL
mmetsp:Transcript_23299/g.38406  ORF Transcript_23299/g.38406 Transcript_23299/m.38406 type:complete len:81 (+) Transcript_23299:593-835(+)